MSEEKRVSKFLEIQNSSFQAIEFQTETLKHQGFLKWTKGVNFLVQTIKSLIHNIELPSVARLSLTEIKQLPKSKAKLFRQIIWELKNGKDKTYSCISWNTDASIIDVYKNRSEKD